jgi:hypothetical protein
MPDVPERAVGPAAEALCALHDLDPEWARTLARAALEAAAPLLAEAWEAEREQRRKHRASALPESFIAWNASRTRAAGHRDAGSATMILARYGDTVSARQRLVAEAKIAAPEASWTEIGATVGMTKDQAAGLFRRMLRTARLQVEVPRAR